MKILKVILPCFAVLLVFTTTAMAQYTPRGNRGMEDLRIIDFECFRDDEETTGEVECWTCGFNYRVIYEVVPHAPTSSALTGEMAGHGAPVDAWAVVDTPFFINILTAEPNPQVLFRFHVTSPVMSGSTQKVEFFINVASVPQRVWTGEVLVYAELDSCHGRLNSSHGRESYTGYCDVEEFDETNNASEAVTCP